MELDEGDRESAISSLTDSFEEEDEQDEHTQVSTRPRLRYTRLQQYLQPVVSLPPPSTASSSSSQPLLWTRQCQYAEYTSRSQNTGELLPPHPCLAHSSLSLQSESMGTPKHITDTSFILQRSSTSDATLTAGRITHSPVQVSHPQWLPQPAHIRPNPQGAGVKPLELPESSMLKGRLWLVQEGTPHTEASPIHPTAPLGNMPSSLSQTVVQCLVRQEEPVMAVGGPSSAPPLLSILSALEKLWYVASD